jgi:hypothetical protein
MHPGQIGVRQLYEAAGAIADVMPILDALEGSELALANMVAHGPCPADGVAMKEDESCPRIPRIEMPIESRQGNVGCGMVSLDDGRDRIEDVFELVSRPSIFA